MNENGGILLKHKQWKMLAYLFTIQTFIAFLARGIAPLGIIIGEDLQLTMSQIGMFPAALFLGQSLVSMPAGTLTDKIGSRPMILIITAVLSGSFLVMTLVSSFHILLLLILISGSAYGSSHPTTNRGIMYWFPIKKRGTAMGIKQMGVTLGSALAAIVLFPLASMFGWQPAFIVSSSCLLLVGIIIYFAYAEPSNASQGNATKHSRKSSFKKLLQLMKHRALILVTFSAMFLSGSQMILNTFIILFAYEKLGINIFLSGILLGIAEVGGSLGRVIWGLVSDHFFKGKRIIVLLLISLLVAFTSIIIALLPQGTPFYIVAFVVFIFGFGTSGFNGIWMNATTEVVSSSDSSTATGISLTFGSWGVIFFPPIFGYIVDTTGLYILAWIFVTFLMVLSIISLQLILKLDH